MKSLRKILAVLTATAMVAGMGVMAFAGTGSITVKHNESITNVSGRTFTAYRILDATYGESGSDITTIAYTVPKALESYYNNYFKIGNSGAQELANASGTTFSKYITDRIAALTTDQLQAFITDLSKNNDLKKVASGTAVSNGSDAKFDGLDSGYYLIVETETEDPVSALMLDTVLNDNVDIIVKANKEIPDKKIVGASGSDVENASGTYLYSGTQNNVSIGSTVNYVVSEHVPNYNGYEYFYYILNDELSKGLTFMDNVDIHIDVDKNGAFTDDDITYDRPLISPSGTVVTETTPKTVNEHLRGYTVVEGETVPTTGYDYYVYVTRNEGQDNTIKIAFNNIMDYPIDAPIQITYSANVNEYAVTGVIPNTNKAKLEYSNRMTSGSSGTERHDSGTPGIPADDSTPILDEGPSSYTDTFTTQLTVNKFDNSNPPVELPGAQFTLTGTSSQVVVSSEEVFVQNPNGDYWMTSSGTYTRTAPTTKAYMAPAPSGATSGYVYVQTAGSGSNPTDTTKWVYIDTPSGTGLAGVYRPYEPSENYPIFILHKPNDSNYASTIVKYEKKNSGTFSGETPVQVEMVLEGSGTNGNVFLFDQLGAGTYTLSETKVPDGYNKAGDITFTIDWRSGTVSTSGTSGTCTWVITSATQNGQDILSRFTSGAGVFETNVANAKGVELPSTGGIGTTIFYAGGAILVLLAGILLVSKRRFA